MKTIRQLGAAALVLGAALGSQPAAVVAEGPEQVCAGLCMAKTTESGYLGEDAIWYFVGCYIGCLADRLV